MVNVTEEVIITLAKVLLLEEIHNYVAYFVDKKIYSELRKKKQKKPRKNRITWLSNKNIYH